MFTVTQFVKQLKQPRGGFIRPAETNRIVLNDDFTLNTTENIHSVLIGIAVDLLTRVDLFGKEGAFEIQKRGAKLVNESGLCEYLIDQIDHRFDNDAIIAACKLSGFDVCYRSGLAGYKDVRTINPNPETIENIRIMVARSVKFFNDKNVINHGMTFLGGYTRTVSRGDADYLTPKGIWDMKVSVKGPSKEHTLQVYVYTQLAKSAKLSGNPIFANCDFSEAGIYNPRLNTEYSFNPDSLDQKYVDEIYEWMNNY